MSKFQASLLNATSMPVWPVWSGSTTAEVEFQPMPKKRAGRLFQKARAHDRTTRKPGSGKHGGALGRIALNVLQVMLFDFMNYTTGRLDPSIDAIARKAGCCARAAQNALRKLKDLGFLTWIRRASPAEDASGGFLLRQETNAYAVLPEECWRGYHDPAPPTLEPWQWGATPPLPSSLARASEELAAGQRQSALSILEEDPKDELAAALARLGRTAGFAANPQI
jgi:hypothetical protein